MLRRSPSSDQSSPTSALGGVGAIGAPDEVRAEASRCRRRVAEAAPQHDASLFEREIAR